LLALAIDGWRSWNKWLSRALFVVLGLGGVVAAPTVALDWYNARDISNVAMNPGNFPWTVHISPDDLAAARWIHRFLPADATVQPDAQPRARYTWAFIPAFARRRMGVGNGLFTLNPGRYEPDMATVHRAFGDLPAEDAYEAFRRIGVDYIYVGDVERATHGASVGKFATLPHRFRLVYRRGTVEVFRIVKD
jgi:uncharacterized membrane protein